MTPRSLRYVFGLCALLAFLAPAGASPAGDASAPEGRLLRFPALSKDSIAFVYGGDIWTVPRAGGLARQITTDAGLEWFPRFSPDGKWIAFTGEYDGNRDVYVMPAEGGEPRRLTWWTDTGQPAERQGPNNEVLGWTPDGKRILFRSRHAAWEDRAGRQYTVGLDGGYPEPLVIPEGGLASYSPDGARLVYNRIFRNFRTWKRYRGGMTQNLWIFDFKANRLEELTKNDNTSTDPMWIGGKIYCNSDREKTFNLFEIDPASKQARKLTDFNEYDVRWASAGPDGIVFENGGYVFLYDLASGKAAKVPIRVPSDQRLARTEFVNAGDRITEYNLSPEGKRAVFVARGEVFTVPAEKGNSRNLTSDPGANDKGASWSPDGKWIVYLSDATGEDEIYIVPQDGKGPAQRLTTDGAVWRFAPQWSPDSKRIAFADKDLKLFVLDVETKKLTQADRATDGEIRDYVWSPDSRWLAYSKVNMEGFNRVFLYSLDAAKVTQVTSDLSDSSRPSFDPEGKYLYLRSDRDFNPALGVFDFDFTYRNPTRIYAITLRADLPSPFAPESDEVKKEEPKKEEAGSSAADKKDEGKKDEGKKEGGAKEEAKKPVEPLKIDLEGMESRIVAFPIPPGNYSNVKAGKKFVLYLARRAGADDGDLDGGPGAPTNEAKIFDMEKRKESTLIAGISSFDVSPDGTKVIYASAGKYGIVDAKPGATAKVGDGALKTDDLQMRLDRRAEWKQIFYEVWRRDRDFFYAKNMNGVDWPAMKARYEKLLPYVVHRSDLTYILGEMIGELNNSHTYVGGGDWPKTTKVGVGNLGVDYALDAASGRYKIAKVLLGENWVRERRSPLTEPGSVVAAGSYVLKVDGEDLKSPAIPEQILENKAGRTVTLLVNDKPSLDGAREVTVKPLADEADLRYFDRIETNRRKVDEATQGKVGYLHIPNMGLDGLNEFVRQYYPQIRKQGMIIDVRNNGGGFVSQLIIERLRRVLASMDHSRNTGDSTYPAQVFVGPLVCLANHYSASDGDIFPYMFKHYNLGPIIGTRTWGGVVGIRGIAPLVDGGYIFAPEFALFNLDSKWDVEGRGVDPDIELDNRDDLVIQGHDPQLEKGIEVVLDMIKKNPPKLPPHPQDPTRN